MTDSQVPLEVDCSHVKGRLDNGDEFLLLDCRETTEYETARIEGAVLVPMSELQERVGEPRATSRTRRDRALSPWRPEPESGDVAAAAGVCPGAEHGRRHRRVGPADRQLRPAILSSNGGRGDGKTRQEFPEQIRAWTETKRRRRSNQAPRRHLFVGTSGGPHRQSGGVAAQLSASGSFFSVSTGHCGAISAFSSL